MVGAWVVVPAVGNCVVAGSVVAKSVGGGGVFG